MRQLPSALSHAMVVHPPVPWRAEPRRRRRRRRARRLRLWPGVPLVLAGAGTIAGSVGPWSATGRSGLDQADGIVTLALGVLVAFSGLVLVVTRTPNPVPAVAASVLSSLALVLAVVNAADVANRATEVDRTDLTLVGAGLWVVCGASVLGSLVGTVALARRRVAA